MSTQQDIYAAGFESHPPMLNKENYVPWSSRLLCYAKSRPNGKLIHNSIINGPYVRRMIPEPGDTNHEVPVTETFHLQTDDELTENELKQMKADDQAIQTILLGLPEDIYAAVDSCETTQEIWLRVQQIMKGSDIGIQEKKAKLFNEWERFTSNKGESIESYYHRFLKLMNDLKRNKHFPEKIASNLKFLNNLQQEWGRHVTIVHQTKDLHTADYTQLYDFLKYNQKEVDELKAERLTKIQDPLALMANSNNLYAFPSPHQDQPSFNQNYIVPGNTNLNGNGNLVAARAEGNVVGQDGNQIRCYNCRGVGHFARNCTVRPRIRDAAYLQIHLLIAQKEEAGIQIQAEEFDLMAAAINLDEIEEVNANSILMANLQQASTSSAQTNKAPVYDSDGSAEVHDYKNCNDNEIFNMFTQEEQYTELLEPFLDQHQVPQNDNNVIFEVTSVEQSGEIVEQHPANFEETCALYDSLYQNLAIEVEKVNSVNCKLKETNADLTTELARYKNQEKRFEISQEKYDKLERCYQQSVYQEQCLSKSINALHLSTGKQIMTLNEQILDLNKQLSKEKSTVSFLLEEKKKLKSDFKTCEDELLDKQIQLEKKIKELNNILVKTGQSIHTIHMLSPKPGSFYHTEQKMALGYQNPFYLKQAQKKQQSLYDGKVLLKKHDPLIEAAKFVGDFKSLAKEADESLTKHKALELEIKRLLRAVKFMGTVRFRNDHVAAILGFGDLQWGNILIIRVYFIEGLCHNLFSVGQFCVSNLEAAFRRNACFVRNLEGVDLLKEERSTNLYTINLHEMASASPICLMAHASSTKSQRLSHLNFDTINDLAKNDLVSGLPKFRYHKEHLRPSCEQGKSKRASHPPKPVPNSRKRLHLLHMDLCGPMRIASINGKQYVLVIVDDYSRYTWVHFLRSKDEAPDVIKTFLKRITVLLQSPIIIIRTDNDTEFKNQVLKEYFNTVGISHQMSSVRTPQQNGVVERRNRTLVEAARTMLIFSRSPLFLWAEAIATAYIGKLGAKGDIGFFIGYSADSCAYRIYNRKTKKIMETMKSKITTQQLTEGELDLLFEAMYDDYIGGQPSADLRSVPADQAHQVRQSSTTSTSIADTTPIPTNSSSQATNSPNTSQDVDELNSQQQHAQQQGNQASLQPKTVADNVPNAMFDANSFVNPFANPSKSAAESSSSQNMDPSNMHTFYQPYPYEFQWTNDHPLEQVIGEPSRHVLTKHQFRSDGDMCMYALTMRTMEPKNVKEAMTDPAWIESMQEELLQFKRMDVWVLVPAPDNISPLTLKWIFKNKHDEEQMVI
nr:hypothetical protein [Tanacetum cinerariifolium]